MTAAGAAGASAAVPGTAVLVVDDDAGLVRALAINLRTHGWVVTTATNGAEALDAAASSQPDVVLLDLGLPDMSGLDVIAGIRGWSRVPIVVLSARQLGDDKVDALDAGADDYVTKPFSIDELLARIRALGRRAAADEDRSATVSFADVTVDLAARVVTRADQRVRLTPTEWQVLELLVRNPDRLVSRQTLLTEIWGPTHVNDSGYLRLYVAQLRKKLEPDPAHPRHLLTDPGMGYRFVPAGAGRAPEDA